MKDITHESKRSHCVFLLDLVQFAFGEILFEFFVFFCLLFLPQHMRLGITGVAAAHSCYRILSLRSLERQPPLFEHFL